MRNEYPQGTFTENGRRYAVWAGLEIRPAQRAILHGQTVNHEPVAADAVEVSLMGSTYVAKADGTRDRRYTDAIAGGQNLDDLRKVRTDRAARIAAIWDRWHLNGLRAGCAHQSETWTCTNDLDHDAREAARRIGVPDAAIPPARPCGTLNGWPEVKRLDLRYPKRGDSCIACGRARWDEPSDHCPVSGYRYGSAWLYEPVPADVLAELRHLFGKPDGWTLTAGL